MPRYRMIIQYDGSRFAGWQVQKNVKTVAGTLNHCLSEIIKEEIVIYGSGRTDAGVHAIGQVAHFDTHQHIDTESLLYKVNENLPIGLNVINVNGANERFHARHHAVTRTYIYQLSKQQQVFLRNFVWTPQELNKPERMNEILELFTGFHDFVSFSAEKNKDISTQVNILKADMQQWGDICLIRFVGSHFLRSMVRRLVGTAVAVANNVFTADDVKRFLISECSEPSRHTAPPNGLFLDSVSYDKEITIPKNIVPPILSSLGKTNQ